MIDPEGKAPQKQRKKIDAILERLNGLFSTLDASTCLAWKLNSRLFGESIADDEQEIEKDVNQGTIELVNRKLEKCIAKAEELRKLIELFENEL